MSFHSIIAAMMATRIRAAAEERGITSGYQLTKVLGVSPSMGARLWKDNVEMIALSTLERLCDALNCEPNDLLVYRRPSAKRRVKQS